MKAQNKHRHGGWFSTRRSDFGWNAAMLTGQPPVWLLAADQEGERASHPTETSESSINQYQIDIAQRPPLDQLRASSFLGRISGSSHNYCNCVCQSMNIIFRSRSCCCPRI